MGEFSYPERDGKDVTITFRITEFTHFLLPYSCHYYSKVVYHR